MLQMSASNADWSFENRARRDLDQCRKFLRRKANSRPLERVREIMKAVRLLRENPKLHPVAAISRVGLPLRRRKAGQFVVVYSFFEPTPSAPNGLVSIRAIRHGREEDVFHGVEESRADGSAHPPSFLKLE